MRQRGVEAGVATSGESPSDPSALARSLFSRAVEVELVVYPAPLDPLHARELAQVERAVQKRIGEFRAGRHCAHRALERLGSSTSPLLNGEDRCPLWPRGIVGSISHCSRGTQGCAGAVVACLDHVGGVGLDIELDTSLDEQLFSKVLTLGELAALSRSDPTERGRQAKLVFSAKEAVYKCQYPLTRTFLEFADVTVEIDNELGRFSARLTPAGALRFRERQVPEPWYWQSDSALVGRFLVFEDWIVTAVEHDPSPN